MDKLLPGVRPERFGPQVVCNSRAVVTRARRLALIRDLSQLLLIVAVDVLFIHWPSTRVPGLGRGASDVVVAAFNLAVAAHVYLVRKYPHWVARRIAATWCAAERSRFTKTALLPRVRRSA